MPRPRQPLGPTESEGTLFMITSQLQGDGITQALGLGSTLTLSQSGCDVTLSDTQMPLRTFLRRVSMRQMWRSSPATADRLMASLMKRQSKPSNWRVPSKPSCLTRSTLAKGLLVSSHSYAQDGGSHTTTSFFSTRGVRRPSSPT